MASEHPNFKLESRDGLAWVTIDRIEDRNSIDSDMMAQFMRLLARLEQDGKRAAVFTGAGPSHFIGGADGLEMMRLDRAGGEAFSRRFQKMLNAMEASPVILLAAINGLCFGGGFEFAMACDLRVAAFSARIGLPEVKVGLIPGGGGTVRLPRLVGAGLAMEMILTGRLYKGEEAATRGLVNLAVPDGELPGAAAGLLARVLRNPGHATSLAKRAVKAGLGANLADGLAGEAELFGRCHDSDFFRELMKSQLASGALTTSAGGRED